MYKKLILEFSSLFVMTIPFNNLSLMQQHSTTEKNIYIVAAQYEQLNYKFGVLNYSQMKTTIGFVTAGQLGIEEPEKLGLETSLTVIHVDEINKRVKVLYTVSKNTYINDFNEASGVITIYAKDAIQNQDLEVIEELATELLKIQTTKNKSFDISQWNIDQIVTARALGIIEPEKNGAKIEYKIKNINLETGEVIVTAAIIKNLEFLDVQIIVKGFKKQENSEQTLTKLLEKITDQKVSLKVLMDFKLSVGSEVKISDLGIENVDFGPDVIATYTVKEINALKNEIIITVTLTRNNQTASKDIKISGFVST